MKKIIIIIMLAVFAAAVIAFDVKATEKIQWNGGYHGDCGGRYIHCPRDTTGEWFYCNRCGAQYHFHLPH